MSREDPQRNASKSLVGDGAASRSQSIQQGELRSTKEQREALLEQIYSDYIELHRQREEVQERKRRIDYDVFESNNKDVQALLFGDITANEEDLGDWETWEKVELIVKSLAYGRPHYEEADRNELAALKERAATLGNMVISQRRRLADQEATLRSSQSEMGALLNLLRMKDRELRLLTSRNNTYTLHIRQLERECKMLKEPAGDGSDQTQQIVVDLKLLIEANKRLEKENRELRNSLHVKYGMFEGSPGQAEAFPEFLPNFDGTFTESVPQTSAEDGWSERQDIQSSITSAEEAARTAALADDNDRVKVFENEIPISAMVLRLQKATAFATEKMEAEVANAMGILDFDVGRPIVGYGGSDLLGLSSRSKSRSAARAVSRDTAEELTLDGNHRARKTAGKGAPQGHETDAVTDAEYENSLCDSSTSPRGGKAPKRRTHRGAGSSVSSAEFEDVPNRAQHGVFTVAGEAAVSGSFSSSASHDVIGGISAEGHSHANSNSRKRRTKGDGSSRHRSQRSKNATRHRSATTGRFSSTSVSSNNSSVSRYSTGSLTTAPARGARRTKLAKETEHHLAPGVRQRSLEEEVGSMPSLGVNPLNASSTQGPVYPDDSSVSTPRQNREHVSRRDQQRAGAPYYSGPGGSTGGEIPTRGEVALGSENMVRGEYGSIVRVSEAEHTENSTGDVTHHLGSLSSPIERGTSQATATGTGRRSTEAATATSKRGVAADISNTADGSSLASGCCVVDGRPGAAARLVDEDSQSYEKDMETGGAFSSPKAGIRSLRRDLRSVRRQMEDMRREVEDFFQLLEALIGKGALQFSTLPPPPPMHNSHTSAPSTFPAVSTAETVTDADLRTVVDQIAVDILTKVTEQRVMETLEREHGVCLPSMKPRAAAPSLARGTRRSSVKAEGASTPFQSTPPDEDAVWLAEKLEGVCLSIARAYATEAFKGVGEAGAALPAKYPRVTGKSAPEVEGGRTPLSIRREMGDARRDERVKHTGYNGREATTTSEISQPLPSGVVGNNHYNANRAPETYFNEADWQESGVSPFMRDIIGYASPTATRIPIGGARPQRVPVPHRQVGSSDASHRNVLTSTEKTTLASHRRTAGNRAQAGARGASSSSAPPLPDGADNLYWEHVYPYTCDYAEEDDTVEGVAGVVGRHVGPRPVPVAVPLRSTHVAYYLNNPTTTLEPLGSSPLQQGQTASNFAPGEVMDMLRGFQRRGRMPYGEEAMRGVQPTVVSFDFKGALARVGKQASGVVQSIFSQQLDVAVTNRVLPIARAANELATGARPMDAALRLAVKQLRDDEREREQARRKLLFRRISTNIRARQLARNPVFHGSAFMAYLAVMYDRWYRQIERERRRVADLGRIQLQELCDTHFSSQLKPARRRTSSDANYLPPLSTHRRRSRSNRGGGSSGTATTGLPRGPQHSSYHFQYVALPHDRRRSPPPSL